MFLNSIKNYFLLKFIKNNLHNVIPIDETTTVTTVGLLLDETFFSEKESLMQDLVANGISIDTIRVVLYHDKSQKKEINPDRRYTIRFINWKGQIADQNLREFCSEKFDLLLNYYDVENALLVKLTDCSKAKFKVGFSSVDKRLNHLLIDTTIENKTVFIQELFKYLKILKKI
jgi:hypothetical protein